MHNKFDIEILPSGMIRFSRLDKNTNNYVFLFLKDLDHIDENKLKEIDEFLSFSDENEKILGNDILCG